MPKSKRKEDRRTRRSIVRSSIKAYTFKFVLCIRYYIDLLIDQIFYIFYKSNIRKVTPPQDLLVLESASNLAKKIQKREVSCEEVVQAFINRSKEVNVLLNAIVDDRFDEALKEAKQIDEDLRTGVLQDIDFQTKPFLGVPFTSKESTAAKGMSATFGIARRRGRKANFDAQIIECMKEAGGILLAVTNVPQLNLWQETNNPIFGITNNPYDTTRTVGGSSGGESSIIAACGSPWGLGTDIGGSARIPAFMCGIFGHKPTCGLISTHGLTFRTGQEDDTMVSVGPLTKYAEDLMPLFKVLVGNEAVKLSLNVPVKLEKIKIYYVENPKDRMVSPIRQEMKDCFKRVLNYFSKITEEKPQKLEIDEFRHGGKLWRYWMTQEDACFTRDIVNREGQVEPLKEILNYFLMRSEFNFAVIYSLINEILPKENDQWAREITSKLQDKLKEYLGNDGVLLYPSAPWPASYHYTAFLRPWNFHLFAIWNALKFPVTQVPLGLNSQGLPMGIQVVAAPYQDRLCLEVAKALEKEFGGYVPPS